ncbi:MAG TPA: hydantoinase/oxoprolinase family protein [Alphaproteobacteria bacterium]|jgi:N-methylhydantoinase A/oxoprolinase/acetone carboxylase beta subunit|nr:hydantoinase/oxoprolinase family protein [Alphaproteobacteria bacterium]HJM49330.1 hydantoinase/oxoprolinase family protein [Alphaproteobacteria bacterium]
MADPVYEIGIDTGGTFTDIVCRGADGIRLMKVPSTPADPSEAIRAGFERMEAEWNLKASELVRFAHGTTVATNAVLQRRGGRTGILATEGFGDVLELGRQMRRQMYDLRLEPETPVFLAPGARRAEVRERVSAAGEVLVPLDADSLARAVDGLVGQQVETIAVCFLFSFLHPEHEQAAREYIEAHHPGVMVSLSSDVDPTFREYERTCVTAFDAYSKPVVDRYLGAMERDLAAAGVPAPLQIMQSRGGLAAAQVARQRPVRLFLSGPAAGVIGGRAAGRAAGFDDLITLDVGGTSCDIALVSGGQALVRPESEIAGFSVRVPMLDINTLGAGGGSIAWLDAAAGLRVGPRSAGADPGPACYGQGGTDPTLTDASVVLGYLNPSNFAGGSMALDAERARQAIAEVIAGPMGIGVDEAALGIHRVANAQMTEGIRLVSVNRGLDPRGFVLLALGGAGALHAVPLAAELGIARVLVPQTPGVLSATGLLAAAVEHEVTAAFHRELEDLDLETTRTALAAIDRRCAELMAAEGVAAGSQEIHYFADICYIGQSYSLEVPLDLTGSDPAAALHAAFLAVHEGVHGHAIEGPARIVNLRSVHRARGAELDLSILSAAEETGVNDARSKGERPISVDGTAGTIGAAIYDRTALPAGAGIAGPAIVEQADTTTLIPPGWRAGVVEGGSLLIERRAPRARHE